MKSAIRKMNLQTKPIADSMKTMLFGFICAFLLSRIRLHGIHAPLALGFLFAWQVNGLDVSGIIAGIAIGTFFGKTPMWQELTVSVVFGFTVSVFRSFKKPIRQMLRFLIFAVIGMATLPLQFVNGKYEILYEVISLALSVLSSFGFVRLIKTCKTIYSDRVLSDAEQILLSAALGCFLLALSDIQAFGWSLSGMLLILLTAFAVTIRGVYGVGVSILWSSMLVLYTQANPLLIGSTALAALIASILCSRGKPFVILPFLLSAVLFETYAQETALSMNTQNLLGAILLYALSPSKLFERLKSMTDSAERMQKTQAETVLRIERNASEEIERMGNLMYDFSGMFAMPTYAEENDSQWLMQSALTICKGCELRRICWKDAERMHASILKLAETMEEGKRTVPIEPIDNGCKHFRDLCGTVLLAHRQASARNALLNMIRSQSDVIEKQFCGVGDALYGSAKQIRNRTREELHARRRILMRLTEAGMQIESLDQYENDGSMVFQVVLKRPLHSDRKAVRWEMEQACGFHLRCIRTMVKKHSVRFEFEQQPQMRAFMQVYRTDTESDVSGDAAGECRMVGGRVCYALSDGMGRGKTAREESEAAIDLLFRLYRAGMHKDLIYDNVNRLLMAKNEFEMYATLDAVSIDLNTGEAEILKYGAPPSFLLRDGNVQPILGEALPCGILPEASPSVIHMKLQTNDRLVLCSDGVQDALPEGAESALKQIGETGAKTGEVLLKLAESRGGTDDMTVMVIRVA